MMELPKIVQGLQTADEKVSSFLQRAKSTEERENRVKKLGKKLMDQFPDTKVDDKGLIVAFDILAKITETRAFGVGMDKIDETLVRNTIMNDCPELFEKGKLKDKKTFEQILKTVNSTVEVYNKIKP